MSDKQIPFPRSMAKWVAANWVPGAGLTRDGLGCFAAVRKAGCSHPPKVVGVVGVVGALKPRGRKSC